MLAVAASRGSRLPVHWLTPKEPPHDDRICLSAGHRPALGRRRKTRGITQETAAEHIGVSRPTFIAIEKGERVAKPAEVVKLAALYGQPVHSIVRTAEPVTDFQPHFRAAIEKVKPAEVDQLRPLSATSSCSSRTTLT